MKLSVTAAFQGTEATYLHVRRVACFSETIDAYEDSFDKDLDFFALLDKKVPIPGPEGFKKYTPSTFQELTNGFRECKGS